MKLRCSSLPPPPLPPPPFPCVSGNTAGARPLGVKDVYSKKWLSTVCGDAQWRLPYRMAAPTSRPPPRHLQLDAAPRTRALPPPPPPESVATQRPSLAAATRSFAPPSRAELVAAAWTGARIDCTRPLP